MEMAEQQVVEQQAVDRAVVEQQAVDRAVVEQQVGAAAAGRRPPPQLVSRGTREVGRTTPVGTHVLPLGPGSRFARLHWGGQCVNCGETVDPGERGWIDPSDTEVLCVTCWPPLMIG